MYYLSPRKYESSQKLSPTIHNFQMTAAKPKSNSIYTLLRWLIGLLSLGVFVYEIRTADGSLFRYIGQTITENAAYGIVLLLLAVINWNGEAYKLRTLLRSELRMGQFRSFLTVLGGMAVSNFTPARTGEYIGRSLLLKGIHPVKVVIATVTGNLAQVLFTYGLGLMAFFLYLPLSDRADTLLSMEVSLVLPIAFLIGIVLLVLFGRTLAVNILERLPKKLRKLLNIIRSYNRDVFGKVALAGGVRYVVFSVQFYVLLQLFSGWGLPPGSIMLIPVAYLMQTLMPVPAITDVGVRVLVTGMLFGSYMTDEALLAAVTSLWFLNLILPGLIGSVYLFGVNLVKKW